MRQLLYISSARRFAGREELDQILEISRCNNRRDGLTGLLWSDGKRFLQVLEGPSAILDTTLQRIRNDDRHHALVVLHDRHVDVATFGQWSMAHMGDDDASIEIALSNADAVVRGTFEGLISARKAA